MGWKLILLGGIISIAILADARESTNDIFEAGEWLRWLLASIVAYLALALGEDSRSRKTDMLEELQPHPHHVSFISRGAALTSVTLIGWLAITVLMALFLSFGQHHLTQEISKVTPEKENGEWVIDGQAWSGQGHLVLHPYLKEGPVTSDLTYFEVPAQIHGQGEAQPLLLKVNRPNLIESDHLMVRLPSTFQHKGRDVQIEWNRVVVSNTSAGWMDSLFLWFVIECSQWMVFAFFLTWISSRFSLEMGFFLVLAITCYIKVVDILGESVFDETKRFQRSAVASDNFKILWWERLAIHLTDYSQAALALRHKIPWPAPLADLQKGVHVPFQLSASWALIFIALLVAFPMGEYLLRKRSW